MKTKKTKSGDSQGEAGIQEKTEIWKQLIITTGVVLVALIGSWQVLAVARVNNQPPTPVPSAVPAAATNTPVSIQPTNTTAPALPVAVIATTGLPSATDTATAISLNLKSVNIDLSKWYKVTNESQGTDSFLDNWQSTKNIVMNPKGYLGGQNWSFKIAAPGYYTLTSEFYGQGIFLHILTDSNYSLNLDAGSDDPKTTYWKVASSAANCVRFISQALGEDWSLDLNTTADVPTPYMAHTSDAKSQCWGLVQVGPIK